MSAGSSDDGKFWRWNFWVHVIICVLSWLAVCLTAFRGELSIFSIDTRENPTLYDRNFPLAIGEDEGPDGATTPGQGDFDQSQRICDITVVWLLDMSANLQPASGGGSEKASMLNLVKNISNVFGFGSGTDAKGKVILFGLTETQESSLASSSEDFNDILDDIVATYEGDRLPQGSISANNVHDALMRLEDIVDGLPNKKVVPIVVTHGDLKNATASCEAKGFIFPTDNNNQYEDAARSALCIQMSMASLLSTDPINFANYASGSLNPEKKILQVFHIPFLKSDDPILEPYHFTYFTEGKAGDSGFFEERIRRLQFSDSYSQNTLDNLFGEANFTQDFAELVFSQVEGCTPTKSPTSSPTISPTKAPSKSPTKSPTKSPSTSPTNAPTTNPTASPSRSPSEAPTKGPTESPTTSTPTISPTFAPSRTPTGSPTRNPTTSPTTSSPSSSPTRNPTRSPTPEPTFSPTMSPTLDCVREVEPDDLVIVVGTLLLMYLLFEMVFIGIKLVSGFSLLPTDANVALAILLVPVCFTVAVLVEHSIGNEVNFCGPNGRALAIICDHMNNPYVLGMLLAIPAQIYFLVVGLFGKYHEDPVQILSVGMQNHYKVINNRHSRAAFAMKKWQQYKERKGIKLTPVATEIQPASKANDATDKDLGNFKRQDLERELLKLVESSMSTFDEFEKYWKRLMKSKAKLSKEAMSAFEKKMTEEYASLDSKFQRANNIIENNELVLYKEGDQFTSDVYMKGALVVDTLVCLVVCFVVFFLFYETEELELCLGANENRWFLGATLTFLTFFTGELMVNPFALFVPPFKDENLSEVSWHWMIFKFLNRLLWIQMVKTAVFLLVCMLIMLLPLIAVGRAFQSGLNCIDSVDPGRVTEWVYLSLGVAALSVVYGMWIERDYTWTISLSFLCQVVAALANQIGMNAYGEFWTSGAPFRYSTLIMLSFLIPTAVYLIQSPPNSPTFDVELSLQLLTFLSICTLTEPLNSIFRSVKGGMEENHFTQLFQYGKDLFVEQWETLQCRRTKVCKKCNRPKKSKRRDASDASDDTCECKPTCKKCGKTKSLDDDETNGNVDLATKCLCGKDSNISLEILIASSNVLNWCFSAAKLSVTMIATYTLLAESSGSKLGWGIIAVAAGFAFNLLTSFANFWSESKYLRGPARLEDPKLKVILRKIFPCCVRDDDHQGEQRVTSVSP